MHKSGSTTTRRHPFLDLCSHRIVFPVMGLAFPFRHYQSFFCPPAIFSHSTFNIPQTGYISPEALGLWPHRPGFDYRLHVILFRPHQIRALGCSRVCGGFPGADRRPSTLYCILIFLVLLKSPNLAVYQALRRSHPALLRTFSPLPCQFRCSCDHHIHVFALSQTLNRISAVFSVIDSK